MSASGTRVTGRGGHCRGTTEVWSASSACIKAANAARTPIQGDACQASQRGIEDDATARTTRTTAATSAPADARGVATPAAAAAPARRQIDVACLDRFNAYQTGHCVYSKVAPDATSAAGAAGAVRPPRRNPYSPNSACQAIGEFNHHIPIGAACS